MCLEPFPYFSISTKCMSMFRQLFCDTMPTLSTCALGVCKSVGYKSMIALDPQSLLNLPPSKLGLYYKALILWSLRSQSPKLSSSVIHEGLIPSLSSVWESFKCIKQSQLCLLFLEVYMCTFVFQGHQGLHIHENVKHMLPFCNENQGSINVTLRFV